MSDINPQTLEARMKLYERMQKYRAAFPTPAVEGEVPHSPTVEEPSSIPETAGMMVGGTLGAPLGPGGVVGGGILGASAAKAAQNYLTGKPPQNDVIRAAAQASAAELLPKLLGKFPLGGLGGFKNLGALGEAGVNKAVELARDKLIAPVSGLLSGAGTSATQRLLQRPAEVLAGEKNLGQKAAEAGKELKALSELRGQRIGDARWNALRANRGTTLNMTEPAARARDLLRRNFSEQADRGALTGKEQEKILELLGTDFGGGTAAYPAAKATADWIQSQLDWPSDGAINLGSKAYKRGLKSILPAVKDAMHGASPGLAVEDAAFTNYANKLPAVSKFTSPDKQEALYNRLSKTPSKFRMDSLKELLPQAAENVLDTQASKAFTQSGRSSLLGYVSPRNLIRLGLSGAGLGAGHTAQSLPLTAGLGALGFTVMSPAAHRLGLGLGSEWLGPMVRPAAEQLLPGALSEAATQLNPWSLMNQEKKK